YRVYMPGIGGTGVVTANQVLAYAAMMEGLGVHVLDQTGLAQKGGAVLSSLTVFEQAADAYASNKVGLGRANLVVGLDTLGVVNAVNADRMSPERTVVVADSTLQPTAEVVRHVNLLLPGKSALQRAIDAHSRASENLWVEAGHTSEALFGDQALTNIFMIGIAYQAGLLPMAAESIEAAIRLNGVAVEKNLQAFRYGRLFQADPARVTRLLGEPVLSADEVRVHKLMAYKDEYEVARLLLKGEWAERVRATFVKPKVKFNLHPPLLRERGLKNKLELGAWFRPVLGMLVPMRRVRGTAWDVFGRAEVRRVERELVAWYRGLLGELSARLPAENHQLAVCIACGPDRIRGYERIA